MRGGSAPSACDVVVVGGGPAGLAAALTLSAAGLAVTVIERSRYDRPRVGESLPPAVRRALAPLAALDLLSRGHLPCHGIRSSWGGAPSERSFLFDPYGCGWHVDRRAFDAALALRAEERGVELLQGSRLTACRQRDRDPGSSRWQLTVATPGRQRRLAARFLIDASGRAAGLARRLGAVRRRDDRLIALVALFGSAATGARGPAAAACEPMVLVEAVEQGWWYSAPLPGGRLVAALMTDADLAPTKVDLWPEQLAAAPQTEARCAPMAQLAPVRRVAADSSRLEPLQGPGWLAAGDAAVACDPLSGDGVQRALETGQAAGEAARAVLAGDGAGLVHYSAHLARSHVTYGQQRLVFYQRERRWPDSPFWRRRHAAAGTPGDSQSGKRRASS